MRPVVVVVVVVLVAVVVSSDCRRLRFGDFVMLKGNEEHEYLTRIHYKLINYDESIHLAFIFIHSFIKCVCLCVHASG